MCIDTFSEIIILKYAGTILWDSISLIYLLGKFSIICFLHQRKNIGRAEKSSFLVLRIHPVNLTQSIIMTLTILDYKQRIQEIDLLFWISLYWL